MKHTVSDLDGMLLDRAVALSCGDDPESPAYVANARMERYGEDWEMLWNHPTFRFRPSSCWAHGGPIVQSSWSEIRDALIYWMGNRWSEAGDLERGRELLPWFMRAFVASKFGEEVELP